VVKDLRTRKPLLSGCAVWGSISYGSHPKFLQPQSHTPHLPQLCYCQRKQLLIIWHCGLGHPSYKIVQFILSKYALPVIKTRVATLPCNACQEAKCHKDHLPSTNTTSVRPFDIIFSDLWMSPIVSFQSYRYCLAFIDDHTKYIWLYPLSTKDQAFDEYLQFQSYIQNQFGTTIIGLHTDGGTEYLKIHHWCKIHGVTSRITTPYTPEQNGIVEWKNQHLIEMALALLNHNRVPLVLSI
jgi:hypothetical protein